METYELANLSITQASFESKLAYERARLFVITEHGSRHWYIELSGLADEEVLRRFAESEEIGVGFVATTAEGSSLSGRGYFHPNPQHRAAAIRGEGPLEGYGQPNGA